MAKEVKFIKQQGSVIDIESVYERLKSVFKTLSNTIIELPNPNDLRWEAFKNEYEKYL